MSYGGAQSFYEKMLAAQKAKEASSGGDTSSASAPAPAGSAPLALEAPTVKVLKSSVVVAFGSTNYSDMGKKVGVSSASAPNLMVCLHPLTLPSAAHST